MEFTPDTIDLLTTDHRDASFFTLLAVADR